MVRSVNLTMSSETCPKTYLIRFKPTKELQKEITEVINGNFDFGHKIELSVKRRVAMIHIDDELSYQMLIGRLKNEAPEKWNSIFKYIYAVA